jgi:DNA-binding HxlR family transcriptional regulator
MVNAAGAELTPTNAELSRSAQIRLNFRRAAREMRARRAGETAGSVAGPATAAGQDEKKDEDEEDCHALIVAPMPSAFNEGQLGPGSTARGNRSAIHLHDDSVRRSVLCMRRKSFDEMPCPIARSLERVGEWWSMLILRDAFAGKTRFDEFEKSLGIAPNMLSRRLAALVEAGMLERRRYSEHPPRDEYALTERGRDFREVLLALLAFGNRHFAPEGERVRIVDAATGAPADPVLVDRATGRVLTGPDFKVVPGPAFGGAAGSEPTL